MSKALELREKRANTWDAAKAFLNDKRGDDGLLCAEDTAVYETMEAEVVALGKEIERLERQAAIDLELERPINSPITNRPDRSAGDTVEDPTGRASAEYKRAFWNAMRGRPPADVQNALQVNTDSEGGFLVPREFEHTLVEALTEENAIRKLAHVITTSHGDRKIPVVATKGTASWLEEEAAIPESDDAFGQVSLGAYKLATMLKVSEELMQDSVFDLEAYIAQSFAGRIGNKEEEAFIVGNGTGKPTGFLSATGGGQLGVTTANATTISLTEILDLYYSLKSPYRRKATFVMHDSMVKSIRKLRDSTGQFLWEPSIKEATPDTLVSRPLITSAFMPVLEASAKTIAFGDFGYFWVADRQGRVFKRLNELYAPTGQVGFLATQRVDAKLILPEAMKFLQMKAA